MSSPEYKDLLLINAMKEHTEALNNFSALNMYPNSADSNNLTETLKSIDLSLKELLNNK